MHDEALDTAVSFLKSLADHALTDEKEQTRLVRQKATAWVRHLSIGADHPEIAQQTKRDFAGARRFVSRTLRDGRALQERTDQQFRDTAFSFASELHAIVAGDVHDDAQLRAGMETLERTADEGTLDELRVVTARIARELFALVAAREERRAQAAAHAAARLPDLLDVLQRSTSLSVDPITGFLDRDGLVEAAERVYLLGSLAEAPVSLSILGLQGDSLRRDTADSFMAALAPTLSHAFLSRNDIIGREGETSFAIISVGADVTRARQACARAKELICGAARDKAQELGLARMELVLGVAPLKTPVTSAFQRARPAYSEGL
ncbi:MAG: hypothetical protein IT381_32425 [Deltaproteobacteria bacterium]|nr:hypothetical protein [Deltaproteobacteria bacterium]